MSDPITIPSPFGEGSPLSARLLNGLQEDILRQLYEHTHAGGTEGPQLETPGYADLSVTEPKLADGAISTRTLGNGAVGPGNIADGAVTQNTIADGAVGTNQIADDAVTEGKLGPDVRLKLNRIGGGVSSASSVIWRDPLVVFQPTESAPSLIETFYQPREVYWVPAMIGLTDNDEPIRLNPRSNTVNGQEVLDSYDIFLDDQLKDQEPVLAKIVEDSVQIATQEISAVGAFALRGDAFANFEFQGGGNLPLSGGFERLSTGMRISGAESAAPPPVEESAPRILALRTATESGGGSGAAARTASVGSGARAGAGGAGAGVAESVGARGSAAESGAAAVALTQNGTRAAARMTTVGVVDANGVPVPPGSDGAYTVNSGFSGKEDFLDDGPALDYRGIGNDADRQRAAKGASETLYNLGLDEQYLAQSGHKMSDNDLQAFENLQMGDDAFFAAENSFLGPQSWLLDLMNNPQLFGSGYAISGGRNILSVVRMSETIQRTSGDGMLATAITTQIRGEEWVRVRFITPYKDSSYAVSVTPRRMGNVLIVPQIKEKSPYYCDLYFASLHPTAGMDLTNKVSFDLAVFGDLTTAE
ncbi:MAG: hypothetical protein AAF637_06005 [Pseudomonadota bacterium]